jgi:hypothetical protein
MLYLSDKLRLVHTKVLSKVATVVEMMMAK